MRPLNLGAVFCTEYSPSPTNVTVSTDIFPDDLTPANASFTVTWDGPESDSAIDRFLVQLPIQNITQVVGKYLMMILTLF